MSENCPGFDMKNCREDLKSCVGTIKSTISDELALTVKKKTFFTFLTIFVTLVCMAVGGPLLYSMAAEKKQNDKLATIEVIKLDIIHIKKAIEHQKVDFKEYTQEQKVLQKEVKQEQKEAKKDILDAIKDLEEKVKDHR